ncbi:MAG: YARHG domain-containing protein [Methylocystaceae bacterium]|nr:MAG: YARHG domain-containing protein [Methylocystaceae bacterium]
MKRARILATTGGIGAIVSVFMALAASSPAQARDPAYMSCGELWYARNAIYARNGYCFETERAQSVFGAGCFPPYGRLHGWEKARVNEIQMWERRKGC